MSVVVLNMEMPEIVSDCPLNSFGICHARGKGPLNCWEASDAKGNLPDWCPLRPLPEKHGRMGDLDAIMNKLAEDKRDAFTKHDVWLMLSKHGAPAIIEAEGG